MDMGIVNAQQVEADKYEKLDKELLEFVEDVLLNRYTPCATAVQAAKQKPLQLARRRTLAPASYDVGGHMYRKATVTVLLRRLLGVHGRLRIAMADQVRECDRAPPGVCSDAGAQVKADRREEARCAAVDYWCASVTFCCQPFLQITALSTLPAPGRSTERSGCIT